MATSAVMQSTLAGPITRVANKTSLNQVIPSNYASRIQRNTNLRVRCMTEKDRKKVLTPSTTPPPSPQLTPTPTPKVSTKFSDVFAFSGPAPERINGRLAMIGFVAAMAVELSNGQDVLAQISNGGVPWFLGTSVVLSLASLIPLFSGVSVESKSKGFMTSDAEMWNGRFAMLGLVALAFTEYVKGSALV
ncbi:hypothetical protein F0562_000371 [Nyssa sinensis]|uniref:Early light-induced protein n=1 Tax=Nyssa sinensis TaxID=561372 RepID=A0A5J5C431_9ASTE|nr:hypothetical protein F0562_000371 [Nyssa sinensis]